MRLAPLLVLLAAAAPAAAATPISPPSSTTGVPVADVGLFADTLTFFDPAGRGEGNNNAANALGAPDSATVSLGDLTSDELTDGRSPGVIVVEFGLPVFNGPGADIAVFENAFDFALSGFPPEFVFAELAFVEVSTNGSDFARFAGESLNVPNDGDDTDTAADPKELITPFGEAFAGLNTTFVRNLAGVHTSSSFTGFFGTPFDLDELAADPLVDAGLVDLNNIRFVRIVDIPGTGDILDSNGAPIFDASVTAGSGGFDLDAVGALNFVPEPSSLAMVLLACGAASRRRRPA